MEIDLVRPHQATPSGFGIIFNMPRFCSDSHYYHRVRKMAEVLKKQRSHPTWKAKGPACLCGDYTSPGN